MGHPSSYRGLREIRGRSSTSWKQWHRGVGNACQNKKDPTWFKKLDVPLFTRENLAKWLFKMECYRLLYSQANNAYEVLMALRQEGIVVDYWEHFEALSAPLTEAYDDMLMGAFQMGWRKTLGQNSQLWRLGHSRIWWIWPKAWRKEIWCWTRPKRTFCSHI